MRWEEIDDNGLWSPTVANKRKKSTKRRHAIPLPRLACQIIKGQRAAVDGSPYVFPGRRRGSTIDPGTPLQARIKSESGVADFFFHGCRHTLETRLAELGVAPHVRDMLLDHAPARGAGAGYDHHHYGPEMLDALERWAGHIEKLVTPAEVLPLLAATERVMASVSPTPGGGEVVALKGRT
jgi:integrase